MPSRPETLAIHAGRIIDPGTGAVGPPLYLSTTFEREADGSYPSGYEYIRDQHPNRAALERTIAALEHGAEAVAFASGSAASMAVLHSVQGGHIVASHDSYHGTLHQLRDVLTSWNTRISLVDTTRLDTVEAACSDNASMLWVETPSNPLLRISDISALSQIATRNNALLAVDNTFATPMLQRPLSLGADLVVHSTTKFIGGHSDVCGGIVVARDPERLKPISLFLKRAGAVPSAFDCWLLQRSAATLPVRMRQHCHNALTVAKWLDKHPQVQSVSYPGLSGHPDYALAQRQMDAAGGVLSFCVPGGATEALQVAARVRMITRATSLGGIESLIEHRASIEGPQTRAPQNLLRLSVGLEHHEDLLADLSQALVGD